MYDNINSSEENPIRIFEFLALENGIKNLLNPEWYADANVDFLKYDDENEIITYYDYKSTGERNIVKQTYHDYISGIIAREFRTSKIFIKQKIDSLKADKEKEIFVKKINHELEYFHQFFKSTNVSKKYEILSETLIALKNHVFDQYPSLSTTTYGIDSTSIQIQKRNESFFYLNITKEGRSNISNLRNSMIKNGFIDQNTELADFRKVFSGDGISSPIIWKYGISYLSYFIKQLHVRKIVEDTKKKKWEITQNCFIKSDGKTFDDRNRLAQM
jgi:hypothetical protein